MSVVCEAKMSAARLAESINSLPPLPSTAQRIMTCFGDEFIDAEKVADVIKDDPGICAKLLGLSNSSYFGLAEPVLNIEEAIARVLGVDTVRSLVLAMAIQQSFNSSACRAFSPEKFWVRSIKTAQVCKKLSLQSKKADDAVRDLAYTAGLCHNLGLMGLAHIESEKTSRALTLHAESEGASSLATLLDSVVETNQLEVTFELAKSWELPETMVAAYEPVDGLQGRSDSHLALILQAANVAVENVERVDGAKVSLGPWSERLAVDSETIQEFATLTEKQAEGVRALAGNMT